jgi:hypothetical protein
MVVANIRVKIVRKTTEILYRSSKQSGRDFKRATLPLNPSVRLHTHTHTHTKTEISDFRKTAPMGAEFFHADGQTDQHNKANARFSQFCGIT